MFSKNDFMENTLVASFNYNDDKVSVPSDLVINIIKSFDVYRVECNYSIYSKGQAQPYQHNGSYTSESDPLSAFLTGWNGFVKEDELDKWGFVKDKDKYNQNAKVHLANGKTISRDKFDKK